MAVAHTLRTILISNKNSHCSAQIVGVNTGVLEYSGASNQKLLAARVRVIPEYYKKFPIMAIIIL